MIKLVMLHNKMPQTLFQGWSIIILIYYSLARASIGLSLAALPDGAKLAIKAISKPIITVEMVVAKDT